MIPAQRLDFSDQEWLDELAFYRRARKRDLALVVLAEIAGCVGIWLWWLLVT